MARRLHRAAPGDSPTTDTARTYIVLAERIAYQPDDSYVTEKPERRRWRGAVGLVVLAASVVQVTVVAASGWDRQPFPWGPLAAAGVMIGLAVSLTGLGPSALAMILRQSARALRVVQVLMLVVALFFTLGGLACSVLLPPAPDATRYSAATVAFALMGVGAAMLVEALNEPLVAAGGGAGRARRRVLSAVTTAAAVASLFVIIGIVAWRTRTGEIATILAAITAIGAVMIPLLFRRVGAVILNRQEVRYALQDAADAFQRAREQERSGGPIAVAELADVVQTAEATLTSPAANWRGPRRADYATGIMLRFIRLTIEGRLSRVTLRGIPKELRAAPAMDHSGVVEATSRYLEDLARRV